MWFVNLKSSVIFPQGENLVIETKVIRHSNQDEKLQLRSRQSLAIDSTNELPNNLIYYVARTQKTVVLDDASNEAKLSGDPYI